MSDTKTLVLSQDRVAIKIKRIAWELYEKHANERKVFIIGISKSGYWLAGQIHKHLRDIADFECVLAEMEINKKDPHSEDLKINIPLEDLNDGNVVLVDDVLNTGHVLIYGVRYLLSVPLKRLTTTVLVDRSHKRYPVKADVKGISLSTSLQEHVEVLISGNRAEVYLH